MFPRLSTEIPWGLFNLAWTPKPFVKPDIPVNPTKLLDLTDEHCKWPLGEKMEPATFFCGRKPVESKNLGKKLPYCELHLLYGYVSKSDKEEDQINEEDLPQFIEKKIKAKSA